RNATSPSSSWYLGIWFSNHEVITSGSLEENSHQWTISAWTSSVHADKLKQRRGILLLYKTTPGVLSILNFANSVFACGWISIWKGASSTCFSGYCTAVYLRTHTKSTS
uniref:Uncharacterized protein n=1 Tax=Triticum urartu TaxID=4572 RepID=A0A8R7NVA2_TRIUA